MIASTILEPDLRVVRASNASPLTGDGTNTYILGRNALCVIDPGPEDQQHLSTILSALGQGCYVQAILVTHAHRDHAPLSRALARETGAPVLAFGDHLAGRSARMSALVAAGLAGGGEGVDHDFRPDHVLQDGASIMIGSDPIRAIWTPGHFGNHLCFVWRGAVFSGDHVMGWSTTLVSPPDGDMSDYMASLDTLEALRARVLYPGHGAPVTDPAARIAYLRQHRRQRESEILAVLSGVACDVSEIVRHCYRDIPDELHGAAARNVLAHLVDLEARDMVEVVPNEGGDAQYRALDRG